MMHDNSLVEDRARRVGLWGENSKGGQEHGVDASDLRDRTAPPRAAERERLLRAPRRGGAVKQTSLFSLAVMTVIVASLMGPACESVCSDSPPDPGESCSGTATCGQNCGTNWTCKAGKWEASVADCFYPHDREPIDAGSDGDDAEAGSDADAACDSQSVGDATPPIPAR